MRTSVLSFVAMLALAFQPSTLPEPIPAPTPQPTRSTIQVDAVGTPVERAAHLKAIINAAPSGTTIDIGAGVYQFSTPVRIPAGVTLRGAGRDETILRNNDQTSSAASCLFQSAGGVVVIEGVTLEANCTERGQSQTVGWQRTAANHATLIIRHCRIIGRSFGVYAWASGTNLYILCERCEIVAGRWAVTAGGGSGGDAQRIDLHDCKVSANFGSQLGAGGDIGAISAGLVARGGHIKMVGGSITVTGHPEMTLAVGAITTPQPGEWGTPGSDFPLIHLVGVPISVRAEGSARAVETEAKIGRVVVQ